MIGQDHDGIHAKRTLAPDSPERLAQRVDVAFIIEQWASLFRYQGGICKSQIVSHNEAKTSEKAEFTWK